MRVSKFQNIVWEFYKHNKRELPWRNICDPYKIFVSEIMLQQTQVSRVLKKYPEFISVFPDFISLANASLVDILKIWKGMGYNRRARFLRQSAQIIIRDFSGVIPRDVHTLIQLPGVGKNTAGSLIAFIYNDPTSFIETNIRRTMLYHFFSNKHNVSDAQILEVVKKTVDIENPREWYYALMDYGSMLRKQEKENPNIRSAHYVRQETFKGSNREIRGNIISWLITHKRGSVLRIARTLKIDPEIIKHILQSMEREGILESRRGVYLISNS